MRKILGNDVKMDFKQNILLDNENTYEEKEIIDENETLELREVN